MPSYYDESKKCRVGTMDESQFYSECESANSACFKTLIAAWIKAGGSLKWGAGGVGLRGPIDGKEVGVCFLAPQFAGKKDRIELACAKLVKQLGDERVKSLDEAIRKAAGELALGKTMLSVVQPSNLITAKQRSLTQAFVGML